MQINQLEWIKLRFCTGVQWVSPSPNCTQWAQITQTSKTTAERDSGHENEFFENPSRLLDRCKELSTRIVSMCFVFGMSRFETRCGKTTRTAVTM